MPNKPPTDTPNILLGYDFEPPPGVVANATADLANRYQEGDIVSTPDRGVGVIAGAVAEDQEAPDDSDLPDIEASPDSPTYVVVTEDESDRGMGLYKASDLDAAEIETDVDALDSTRDMAEASALSLSELAPDDSEVAELDFTMPESWRESDTPSRVIALGWVIRRMCERNAWRGRQSGPLLWRVSRRGPRLRSVAWRLTTTR